jgi:hypothetical protein
MVDGYTKRSLENRVAQHYEDLYAETFPSGGKKKAGQHQGFGANAPRLRAPYPG